jgi:hypothetical protein
MTNEEFIKSVSLEGEIWKDVVGYEGCYKVSSKGQVISLARVIYNGVNTFYSQPKLLIQYVSSTGYYTVTLSKNAVRKKFKVHRLVAIAFINNPEYKLFIDHINTIRTDNRIENLRWVTRSENALNPITRMRNSDYHKGKLTWNSKRIVQIKNNEVIRICNSSRQFSQYGFSQSAIIQCCLKRRTHHKGYHFAYLSDYEKSINKSKNE